MPAKNKAVDAYIDKAADFAKPVLRHIRELVHKACPGVEEKIKWSFPHFDYKGEMMCSMAAFKQHAVMGFWKAALMKDTTLIENARAEVAMGHMGRLTSLKDLPSDKKLVSYIKEAMKLNELGIKLPAQDRSAEKKELLIPGYFTKALKSNRKALAGFEKFPYSHKKEYVKWITEAKTETTREKRIKTALEWIAEGKSRLWKYAKK